MIEIGFKHTELGQIPEDWVFCHFEDVLQTFSAGATPYRGIPSNFQGTIKWISSGELNYCRIYDTIEHISREAQINTHLKIHKPGTFLMAITGLEAEGTRGKCAFVGAESTTNQSCLAINSTDKMTVEYLYWFYRKFSEILAFKYCQGTKQQSYTADIVKKLPIYLPPTIREQERIAEVLSDVDALISSFDKLIAKKQAIKQGAMQLLLTGKKRLKGFNEPWVEKSMGNIGSCYNGLSGKTKSDFEGGNCYYITFLNILNNAVLNPKIFEKVNVEVSEKQNKVLKNDLFFNTSSETPEEVGICSVLLSDVQDLYLNSFCFGFRVSDVNVYPLFLTYFFRSKMGRDMMSLLAQGVTRYNISKSAFLISKIFLPPTFSEQRAVATILTDMDNEIEALQRKKAKYEVLKCGMMQQLLTGRIRLLVNEEGNVQSSTTNTPNIPLQPNNYPQKQEDNSPKMVAD
ncbi:MAG: restriction endonuclease subunit S [Prevotella sp.]|nr:restriction endonuclease subunit S [Prevotella sp.]